MQNELSLIHQPAVLEPSEFQPKLSSSYKVYNSLMDEKHPKRGCFFGGRTVYGDVTIDGRQYMAYSTPVFAYLAYSDTISVVGEKEMTIEYSEGVTTSFTGDIKAKITFDAGINLVNTKSEIELGFSASVAWSSTKKTTEKTKFQDGTYNLYQIAFVYAQQVVGAWDQCHKLFDYSVGEKLPNSTSEKLDLIYFIGLNTNKIKTIKENPKTPLSWNDIQTMLVNSCAQKQDLFSFDFQNALRY